MKMYRLYIYSESKNGFVKNRILKVEYGKYHVNLNESLDQSDPVNDLTLFRGVSDPGCGQNATGQNVTGQNITTKRHTDNTPHRQNVTRQNVT